MTIYERIKQAQQILSDWSAEQGQSFRIEQLGKLLVAIEATLKEHGIERPVGVFPVKIGADWTLAKWNGSAWLTFGSAAPEDGKRFDRIVEHPINLDRRA